MTEAQKNILKVFRLQTVLKECGHDMNVTVFAHTTHVDWRIYIGGYDATEENKFFDGGFYYDGPLAIDEAIEREITELLDIVHYNKLLWS